MVFSCKKPVTFIAKVHRRAWLYVCGWCCC